MRFVLISCYDGSLSVLRKASSSVTSDDAIPLQRACCIYSRSPVNERNFVNKRLVKTLYNNECVMSLCHGTSRPQDKHRAVGFRLTRQNESPNEWAGWETHSFIVLSQVTQHSEHFPRSRLPMCGKNNSVRMCACVLNVSNPPNPGLSSIMFYVPLLLNQSASVLPNIVFPPP